MSVDIDSLEIKIQAGAEQAAGGIDRLTSALTRLKDVAKGGARLTAVANQLSKLNTALSGIHINSGRIGALAEALNGLASVQRASGLSSTVNALKKLPEITKQLDATDLNAFAAQMERVAAAVRPLATEMQKVSNGFAAFPIRIQKLISSNTALAASNTKTAQSFVFSAAKLGIFYTAVRRAISVIGGWITESNNYIENLNLFNVAMGEGAQEAYDYAYAVQDALGIDPSEWMRNQGVFKQITSGFGVVEEKANLMSKNLTQIGYDISSFFNIDIEDAMQKVQSGISGELEPLRRLGYALDQATLQEIAYKHGIDMKVSAMTQAEKSQLRYLAIMEQSTNVMGDMARTIQTPANALRILNQQITQLSRALGNLLMPFLQTVLPYIQAFVELLTEAIQRLAVLVGFELPEIDDSNMDGVTSGADEADSALGSAAESAKDLKKAVLGIDELNILAPQTVSGSVSGGDLGLDLPEYDFLGDAADGKVDEIVKEIKVKLQPLFDWLTNNFDTVKTVALGIGTALVAWKISDTVVSGIDKALNLVMGKGIDNAGAYKLGITLSLVGMIGAYEFGKNLEDAKTSTAEYISGFASLIAAGVGGALIGGKLGGGTGALIGLAISVPLSLVFTLAGVINERAEQEKAEFQEAVNKIYEVEYGSIVDSVRESVSEAIAQSEATISNYKIKIESIQTTLSDDLATVDFARELLDQIYELEAKANQTPADIAQLKKLIETFNALDLIDVELSFDEISKSLNLSQQDANALLDATENLIKQEAYRELLLEEYKLQANAQRDLLKLTQSRNDATAQQQEIDRKISTIEKELNNVLSEKNKLMETTRTLDLGLFTLRTGDIEQLTSLEEKEKSLNQELVAGKIAYADVTTEIALLDGQMGIVNDTVVASEENMAYLKNELGLLATETVNAESDLNTLDTTLGELDTGDAQDEISAITDELAGIITETDSVIESLPSKVNSINEALGKIIDKIDISIIPSFSSRGYDDSLDYSGQMGPITARASGGYVQTGQLFLAREAGPEMVGSIGGRTAVANNQQIVEGISAGVADANAAQNALLREQNELLRAILAKEGAVRIDSKAVKQAYDAAVKQSGFSVMPGGVMV